MGADESSTVLVAHIAQQMMATCPRGWQRAQVRWRRVGSRQEHDGATVDADGEKVTVAVPEEVLALFDELRRRQHSPETGPWFSARVRLARPDRFALDTDADEPVFAGAPPDVRDYAEDVAALGWTTPPRWLTDILEGAALAQELPRVLQATGAAAGAITFDTTPHPDRWCISRHEGRWWSRCGDRHAPAFSTAGDAVAYALGHLVLAPTLAAAVFRAEHPVEALPGDPPLTLYRNLRKTVLAAGTIVDRLGSATGNVTYLAGTPFPLRSLPPELTQQPSTLYQVHRPVEVLMGEAVAWFGQPGGGTACVLPWSVRDLVAAGVLVRTDAR